MSEDITFHDLERVVAGINRQITGNEESCSKDNKDRAQYRVGSYILVVGSMGASLRRVTGHGSTTPITMPTRNYSQAFDQMMAFYQGFCVGRKLSQTKQGSAEQ